MIPTKFTTASNLAIQYCGFMKLFYDYSNFFNRGGQFSASTVQDLLS